MHFISIVSLTSFASSVLASPVKHQVPIVQLWEYNNATFLENINVRPNGQLILSSLSTPDLLAIDPANPGEPTALTTIPNANALLASASIAPDIFAIHAGISDLATMSLKRGSAAIWEIDLREEKVKTRKIVSIPNTRMLNGIAALPTHPYIVLSLDSFGGRIFRTNTRTGEYDVVFQNTLLGPSAQVEDLPLGANGLKIRGCTLYFTNSAQGFVGRMKIDDMGQSVGDIVKIHTIKNVSITHAFDDLAVTSNGYAYVAMADHKLVGYSPDGKEILLVDGEKSEVPLYGPTSVALNAGETKAYIASSGLMKEVDGIYRGGQVLEISI